MSKESKARIIDLTDNYRNFLDSITDESSSSERIKKLTKYFVQPSAEYIAPLRSFSNLWLKNQASFLNENSFNISSSRQLLDRLRGWKIKDAVLSIHQNAEEFAGHFIECDIILFFTFGYLIDGITVYSKGRPTIYIGLDYPEADKTYFEIIAGHEIGHAARDTTPGVLQSYGANLQMEHGELLSITPFREHFIGEGMATLFSKLLTPGQEDKRYLFYGDEALKWCKNNFNFIEEKLLREANDIGNIGRYYRKGSLKADSPGREDYFYGFTVSEQVCNHIGIKELLGRSSLDILRYYFSIKTSLS